MLRRRPAGNPHLVGLRVGLFFLGAGLWVAGVVAELGWLTATAIGILAIAIGLRLLRPRRKTDDSHAAPEEER